MPTYFLSANMSPDQASQFERNIKAVIPDLVRISKLEEIVQDVASQPAAPVDILVPGPADNDTYIDRIIEVATQQQGRFFFILVSPDISTANYKRLVRTGNADWVSLVGAPQEIAEILAKRRGSPAAKESPVVEAAHRPTTVAFLPSAGGVGNTTLITEIGVWLKLQKAHKARRICAVDLDFQTSHICDYLDIEPRMQIQEIVENPERLDAQLFDIFASRHSSGLDIFAAPCSKFDYGALNMAALDTLFQMIATRYDLILIDLPVTWFGWTVDVITNSNAVVLTGINTIPCLRQLAQTLAVVHQARPSVGPDSIAVVINRSDRTLLGGVERRQHVESVLTNEQVFYVANDPAAFIECANTGSPLALASGSRKTMKDIAAIAEFCTGLNPASVKAA